MSTPDVAQSPAGSGDQTTKKAARKPHRIISCVKCQQRKIKCDRNSPCANCMKSRLQCVPASALGPRQRRRRIPERELLNRLRHCEKLLRLNNISCEPSSSDIAQFVTPIGDNQQTHDSASTVSPSATTPETISETRDIWHAINDRIGYSDEDSSENEVDAIRRIDMVRAWEEMQSDDSMLFGDCDVFVNRAILHPDQVQIFRLWQIYIDNVEPIAQLVHTPTMQKRLIDVSSNVADLDPNLEALMFGMYCMAVKSLSPEDCQSIFGVTKEYLGIRYQLGCQQALLAAKFHRTNSRECLTAVYFYMMTLKGTVHAVSLSAMLGVAVRIARRMGLHAEVSNSRCEPFEAEMRRRLWWSLVHLDGRICEMVDHTATSLDPTWDCRVPLNLNTFDLRPEMDRMVPPQDQPAESVLSVTRDIILDFVRHSDFHLDFVNPILKSIARRSAMPWDGSVERLESFLEENYLKTCNPENPIQLMTLWTTRSHIARLKLVIHCAKPITEREADQSAIYSALKMLEYHSKLKTYPPLLGYAWYTDLAFPFIAWTYIAQAVKRRPLGEAADMSWLTMATNYEAVDMYQEKPDNRFYAVFIKMINSAWEAREAACIQANLAYDVPLFVLDVRKKMSNEKTSRVDEQRPSRELSALSGLSISEQESGTSDSQYDNSWFGPNTTEVESEVLDMESIVGQMLWN